MHPDATLDALLLALLRSPRDAALIAVIGDRLKEIKHRAAGPWRWICRADAPAPAGDNRSWGLVVGLGGYLITASDSADYPGIADLCARLDRLAAVPLRRD